MEGFFGVCWAGVSSIFGFKVKMPFYYEFGWLLFVGSRVLAVVVGREGEGDLGLWVGDYKAWFVTGKGGALEVKSSNLWLLSY